MKIKKGIVNLLIEVLVKTNKISLPDGRIRDEILRQLAKIIKAFEEDRMKIIEKFGKRDKDKQLVMKKNDNYDLGSNQAKFEVEYEKMCEEEVTLDCDETKLKYFVDQSSYEPGTFQSEAIYKIFSDEPKPKKKKK